MTPNTLFRGRSGNKHLVTHRGLIEQIGTEYVNSKQINFNKRAMNRLLDTFSLSDLFEDLM